MPNYLTSADQTDLSLVLLSPSLFNPFLNFDFWGPKIGKFCFMNEKGPSKKCFLYFDMIFPKINIFGNQCNIEAWKNMNDQ